MALFITLSIPILSLWTMSLMPRVADVKRPMTEDMPDTELKQELLS